MPHEVEGELALHAECALIGGAVHCREDADQLVAARHEVDRAAHPAVGADRAGRLRLSRDLAVGQRLEVAERAGRTGLDALPAKGARRVLEEAAELGGDLRVEAPVHDRDRVVALLLGADAHAAVAGDAVVVVALDEGVVVVLAAVAGERPLEAPSAGVVAVEELRHLLRGVPVHGVHIGVAVLRRDHLHQDAALDLEARRPGAHHHPGLGLRCARGHRVARTIQLDHAEPAAPEGLEAGVVAQGRDFLAVPLGDFVEGLAA